MSRDADLSKLEQDVLEGLSLDLFHDDLGQAMLQIFNAGVCDERVSSMIQHRLHKHRVKQAFSGMPFIPPQLPPGELTLGLDQAGNPVRIPLQWLNAHSLMVAGTGQGKTSRAIFMAMQVASHVPGMWMFDFRKREFRILRHLLARMGINVIVVDARQTKINPLQVPVSVLPQDWAPRVADGLVMILSLPPRATKLINTTIIRLYHANGIYAGSSAYPTLFDLRQAIATDKSANVPAKEAVLDSLDPLLLSLGPGVLGYHVGWTSRDLSKRHIVFEFAGLAETEKDLLLNTLVLSEFTSRVAAGISNPRMDLWICCDESMRLCSASRNGPLSDLIGLVRGTGVGLDLGVQSAHDIHPHVLSNTTLKILGHCGSASDYSTISNSIGLSAEELRWCQQHLEPGLFLTQVAEGPWRRPFVFRVPAMRLPNSTRNAASGLGPAPGLNP